MDLGIRNRTALVCAASKGIGYAAAESLAKEGANLVLAARSPKNLEAAAQTIADKHSVSVEYFAADLVSRNDREKLLEKYPNADILVANPGAPQRFADALTLSRKDREWWMEAHFYSMIELIQAYLPGMISHKFGRVINISVSFIKFPQVSAGHSHAARLALAGSIAALVREAAPYNVTINSVLPGLINTEALKASLSGRAKEQGVAYEQVAAGILKTCPAGRLAEPFEIGDLVAMLASAQMGFLTGQNIVSDGGAYQGLF